MNKIIRLLTLTCFLNLLSAEEAIFDIEEMDGAVEVNPCGASKPLSLCDAIRYTLENQTRIKIAFEEVNRQKGVVQELAGPFDAETSLFIENVNIDNAQTPSVVTNKSGDITTARISEAKQFRVGTRVEVNAEINQVKDPSSYLFPYNEGSFNFSITQPLLQGFMYGLQATDEMASKEGYKAVYYDSLHSISGQILNATINYWNVVEAQKLLAIRQESVDLFEQLYEKTLRLVEKDELAKSELNQPLANLATARALYAQSEQILYARMQLLKLSLGLVSTSCISTMLFEATDDFPEIVAFEELCKYMELLVQSSLVYRNDLIALDFRKSEIQYLLKGANNELLPELDVFYRYDVDNFKRGGGSRKFFSGYDVHHPRQSNTVGVSFSMPFCNDEAKGRYRRFSAELNTIALETLDLKQTIISEVQELWINNQRLIIEMEEARAAVERFQQLVKDENRRLSEGLGSLFNLIDFQNRMTNSQERYVIKKREYAENIARIRYTSGLLVSPDSNLCYLNVNDVMKLPTLEVKRQ